MSTSTGAPDSKRHWFVAAASIVCFATAWSLVFSQFYHPTEADFQAPLHWTYTWMWSLLELFPNPARVGALIGLFRPWREFLHGQAAAALVWNAALLLSVSRLAGRSGSATPGLARPSLLPAIPVVLGNIIVYGQQFTYCAEGSIYPCSRNLAARLLPYYGFPIAGIAVSIAAFAFLWRYGLEPPGHLGAQNAPLPKTPDRFAKPIGGRADGVLTASRWIVVAMALCIAADYSYFIARWYTFLLPRFSGSGHALSIRILAPLVLLAIASYGIAAIRLIRRVDALGFALVSVTALACVLAPFLGIDIGETLEQPFLLGMGVLPGSAVILLSAATYLAVTVFAIAGLWPVIRDHGSPAGSIGAGLVVPLVFVLSWPQVQMNLKSYSTFSRFPKATPEKKTADDRQTAAL